MNTKKTLLLTLLMLLANAGYAADMTIPKTVVSDTTTTLQGFLAFGPWAIESRADWHKLPDGLKIEGNMELLPNELASGPLHAGPKIISDGGAGIDFSKFNDQSNGWAGDTVMLFLCNLTSEKQKLVILNISNDDNIDVFLNGKYLGVVGKWLMPHGEQYHPFPIMLAKGENFLALKILSSNRIPRLKIDVVSDGSCDFNAAWGEREGLLTRLVYTKGISQKKPAVQWSPLLDHLAVQASVFDSFTGKAVRDEELHSKDLIFSKDKKADPPEGVYLIKYESATGSGEERFVVGDPEELTEKYEALLEKINPDEKGRINAGALIERMKILYDPDNYNPNNINWEEKVAYALYSLSSLLGQMSSGVENPARDSKGLYIRGFQSEIDGSTQYYRLFVPRSHKDGEKLPLLIIFPTSISATKNPFIASAFIAAHHDAVNMSRVAEKYGLALLWPGYRNAPEGLPCENAYLNEVLQAVGKDYYLDEKKISLYAVCSGGIFAGNAVAAWPERFASIIYNRAIFSRLASDDYMDEVSKEKREWLQGTDPEKAVLENGSISIFATNTEIAEEGHGEAALTDEFIKNAKSHNRGITVDLSTPPPDETPWDRVFRCATSVTLAAPSDKPKDVSEALGYSGPMSEIFSTPVAIIQGTDGTKYENDEIEAACSRIQDLYASKFYSSKINICKDIDFNQQDFSNYSVILVGNSKTNKAWEQFEVKTALRAFSDHVTLNKQTWPGRCFYQAIFRNPENNQRYILFIGATEVQYLKYLPLENIYDGAFDYLMMHINNDGTFSRATGKLGSGQKKTNQ